MKTLIASVLAAVSMSAFAEWERIGAIKVADMSVLGEAVGKVGQMAGNPLVAAGVASAIADMSTLRFFGPMRPKCTMVFPIFLDSAKAAAEGADEAVEFAVLYPVTLSKADFIRRHPGACETNGVVVVRGNLDGKDLDDEKTYVVFSKDGKWAGASDKVRQARLALGDIPLAKRTMGGDAVRLFAGSSAFKCLLDVVREDERYPLEIQPLLRSVDSAVVGLKVTDLGIDLTMRFKLVENSEYSNVGLKQLEPDPFAFAGNRGVFVCAYAEDSGRRGVDDAKWKSLVDLCVRHGIDISSFLLREGADGRVVYTIDIAAFIDYVSKNEKKFAKFDFEKFMDDMNKSAKGCDLSPKGPSGAMALAVKGHAAQCSVAERFALTLPGVAVKKPYSVGFISLSSLLKSSVPALLKDVPENQRATVVPMVSALVAEPKRGSASAYWRDGGEVRGVIRVSSDEIRSLGTALSGIMSFGVLGALGDSDSSEDAGDGADDED